LVKGVQQSEKEFTESISELLSGLEGQWDKSVNALVGKLRDALTEQKVLEDLGGGDFSSGIAKAEQLANDLGTSFRTVVDILQGEANPQTRALLEKIAGTREQVRQLGSDLNGEVTQEMVRINNAGAELVDKWEEQNKRIQTGRHQIDLFKSAQDDVAAGASRTADAMERQAQAMQRVNDLLLTTINRTGVVASNTLNGIGTIF
jgi:transcriptional regulator with XRE-family HTH domain